MKTKNILKYFDDKEKVLELLEYNKNLFTVREEIPMQDEHFIGEWNNYIINNSLDIIHRKLETCLKSINKLIEVRYSIQDAEINIELTPAGKIPIVIISKQNFDYIFSHCKNKRGSYLYFNLINTKNTTLKNEEIFIIVSKSEYLGISNIDMHLDNESWLSISIDLKKNYEKASYFLKRVFNNNQNNLINSIFCNYISIVNSIGEFKPEWAFRFIDFYSIDFPNFKVYNNIRKESIDILKLITLKILKNIEIFHKSNYDGNEYNLLYTLTYFTLRELSSDFIVDKLESKFKFLFVDKPYQK